ncbi:MAG: phosphate/phosphite/phosphonate ABC transporter substrate-binding protein [Alphaproteobacteria bacterium]
MRSKLTSLVALVMVLCAMPGDPLSAHTLTVGAITNEPAREFRVWNPWIRYLTRQLEADGVTEGKFVTARDSLEMARLMRNGTIDLFMDSPLVAYTVNESSESVLFLRRWKDGQADCHSAIFTRAGSAIQSIRDLAGHKIAFSGADSTSSYIVPRSLLTRAQLRLIGLEGFRSPAPAEQVGFVFSGSDENTIFLVLAGHVDAGAAGGQDVQRMSESGLVRVVEQSVTIPCHVMSHRPGLPAKLASRIRAILIGMDQTDEGRAVLARFDNTVRFGDIAPEILTRIQTLASGQPAKVTAP